MECQGEDGPYYKFGYPGEKTAKIVTIHSRHCLTKGWFNSLLPKPLDARTDSGNDGWCFGRRGILAKVNMGVR